MEGRIYVKKTLAFWYTLWVAQDTVQAQSRLSPRGATCGHPPRRLHRPIVPWPFRRRCRPTPTKLTVVAVVAAAPPLCYSS